MSPPLPSPSPSTSPLPAATIDMIGEDLLYKIFTKLHAVECAAAACVSRSWNVTITRLLSLPKLSSALSLSPSLQCCLLSLPKLSSALTLNPSLQEVTGSSRKKQPLAEMHEPVKITSYRKQGKISKHKMRSALGAFFPSVQASVGDRVIQYLCWCEVAVNDVADKVLASPIRPQFVIASIGPAFDLDEAHRLITGRFGSRIPVITSTSQGIFGQNATSNEFEEVQWDNYEDDEAHADLGNENHGALLTVGFLPGLAVDLIPLSKTRGNQVLMIVDLVLSVKERSSSRSGSASPVGILLFSDEETDIRPVLEKFDYAFSTETVIVGDGGSQFLYRGETAINPSSNKAASSAAVALLFSRDRGKPPGKSDNCLKTGTRPPVDQNNNKGQSENEPFGIEKAHQLITATLSDESTAFLDPSTEPQNLEGGGGVNTDVLVALLYNFDIPRAVWNPPLTRRESPQPKCAARVGVPESDTPQGSRPA
ncbi:putative kinesin-4-like [Capsicum annuum]|nr:putative kinesin-4-like [Capsicum annuum]